MGIHNRDYYRADPPPAFASGPASSEWAIRSIIIACVAVFIAQNAAGHPLDGPVVNALELNWRSLTQFQLWRAVTYGFCHADIWHLFFNMFGLWIFGRMIEPLYGPRETLAFFLAAVAISGPLHVAAYSISGVAGNVIGASGGVFAVTILTAMHFPRQQFYLMFLPIPIELRWLAAFYVGYDVFGVISGGSHIANLAHLVGAAFGAVYFLSGVRLTSGWGQQSRKGGMPRRGFLQGLLSRFRRSSISRSSVRIYEPPPPPKSAEELASEVDRILDKINQQGRDSLSPEEEATLVQASQSYRNRV